MTTRQAQMVGTFLRQPAKRNPHSPHATTVRVAVGIS